MTDPARAASAPAASAPAAGAPAAVRPAAGGHPDQVRALFDTKAAGWPGKYAPDGRLAARLTQLADAVVGLAAPGGELLDLGCASGELARHLAGVGYRVIGCDIAPRMLELAARADQRRQVRWVRLDSRWQTLPFAPASLDAVIASSVLEYVLDPAAVLRECARVLRPGGILLCTVPDQSHPVRWLEGPLRRAAAAAPARGAGHAWPRLGRYLTYLRISRQRRPLRWWRATAGDAGLRPVPWSPGRPGRPGGPHRGPLRLLAFTLTGGPASGADAPGRGHHDSIGGIA